MEVATDVTLPAADVRTTPVEVGEPVLAVGYPGGGPATITTGRVVGVVFAVEADRGWGLAVPVQALLERIEGAAFTPPSGDC